MSEIAQKYIFIKVLNIRQRTPSKFTIAFCILTYVCFYLLLFVEQKIGYALISLILVLCIMMTVLFLVRIYVLSLDRERMWLYLNNWIC